MTSILIIGAGMSGLTAARKLLEAGHNATVVEAAHILGGRIHTLDSNFTKPVELGAEFIHGKQPLTFALMKEARCRSVLRKGNHYTIVNGELEKGDIVDEEWNELMRELSKLKQDTDLANFLETRFGSPEYDGLRERVRRFAEGFDIADVDKVSTNALRDEWSNNDEEHQYHIDGGYHQLIDYLHSKVLELGGKILVGSKIVEVQWTAGNVKALLENGSSIAAERVIITVSLGVLKKGSIRFSPHLPSHEEAFQHIGYGGVIKFLFEFREPFWEELKDRSFKKLSFIFSDAAVPTWWTQRPDEFALLTGWLGGPASKAAPGNIDGLYKNAEESLCYVLGCSVDELRSQIRHWHITNWNEDPNQFGAYTYPMIRSGEARKFLSTPVESTIYFAGEGVYDGKASGTVEAAVASGLKVVEAIIVDTAAE